MKQKQIETHNRNARKMGFFFLYLSHLNRHRMCECVFSFEVRSIGTPSVESTVLTLHVEFLFIVIQHAARSYFPCIVKKVILTDGWLVLCGNLKKRE